jgi:histidinol-phosphate aminotransferase
MFDLQKITRKNIWELKPYSSARDEYTGKSAVFLDANENPYETGFNRYPDPQQRELKEKLGQLKGIAAENIFLGNGSDEPIDLLFRVFCEPATDNVVIPDPTYGMYEVCARINNIKIKNVSLTTDYQLDVKRVLEAADNHTKLIFMCSPNNPTSNRLDASDLKEVIRGFSSGIVVLDEAYIDFSNQESLVAELDRYPNLVVLQTFSKAWGLAGIRLGMAFASKEIVKLLTKVKYPYNINIMTQQKALEALDRVDDKEKWVSNILEQRNWLEAELKKQQQVETILPSDTNFLMVKVKEPKGLYAFLVDRQIIVRDRSKVHLCMGFLRITIGTEEENKRLMEAMEAYRSKSISN